MATTASMICLGDRTAENDLSAKQFYIAEIGAAAGQVDVADALADKPIGVIQNKPKAGEAVELAVLGKCKVIYGGTVAEGDALKTDASGKAIVTTTALDFVLGIALKAGAANDIGEVLLTLGQRY